MKVLVLLGALHERSRPTLAPAVCAHSIRRVRRRQQDLAIGAKRGRATRLEQADRVLDVLDRALRGDDRVKLLTLG